MASGTGSFKGRDEYRRQMELEEARKAGIAPAEVDEDGKEINPHIPQYMSSAPWYLQHDRPTLKHQKDWRTKEKIGFDAWYERGAKTGKANKYRKGACQNCGAMSHKAKDCVERPRTKGAKWTNKHIAADEKVETVKLDFDGKRDRWNGYDAAEYSKVIDKYEKVDQLKQEIHKKREVERKYKGEEDQDQAGEGRDSSDDDEEGGEGGGDGGDDEEKEADTASAAFGEVKKRVRTAGGGSSGTVRNLRIREDTAKYLINLDLNSAHYDPKSRSMREDPTPFKDPSTKQYSGDNFVRKGGDSLNFQQLELHAWEAYGKGQDIHMQGAPSQAELLHAEYRIKKEKLQSKNKDDILAKYGNAAEKPSEADEQLLLGQTERYVEYDRTGRVVSGEAAPVARSRWEEDVLLNNHTAVWGSWWDQGVWGFACCRQAVKNSYCTGRKGIEAASGGGRELMEANVAAKAETDRARAAAEEAEPRKAEAPVKAPWGEADGDVELDPKKLKKAMKKLEKAEKKGEEMDERKRGFNSLEANDVNVTEEEMEAYRLKKARMDDPMAAPAAGTDGYDLV